MLVVGLLVFTVAFYTSYYVYAKKLPELLSYIVCATAMVGAIQNARFFYLLLVPSLQTVPNYGKALGQGFGLIDVPLNLDVCLKSLGSNFDLLTIAMGPLAVAYISIKQVIETILSGQSSTGTGSPTPSPTLPSTGTGSPTPTPTPPSTGTGSSTSSPTPPSTGTGSPPP